MQQPGGFFRFIFPPRPKHRNQFHFSVARAGARDPFQVQTSSAIKSLAWKTPKIDGTRYSQLGPLSGFPVGREKQKSAHARALRSFFSGGSSSRQSLDAIARAENARLSRKTNLAKLHTPFPLLQLCSCWFVRPRMSWNDPKKHHPRFGFL